VKIDPNLILQIADRLKDAVRDQRPLETAQVHVVGLDQVKANAGASWNEISGRVREGSMAFIAERVGPGDVVIPAGDGFVVIYADADGQEAKREALQNELNAFYMSDETTKPLSANIQGASFGPDMLIEQLRKPDPTPFWEIAKPMTAAELPLSVLPVWSVGQEAVTGYWITPEQVGRPVGRFAYDPVWAETGWHREDKDFLELDLRILAKAVAEVQACLQKGRRCLVGYTVHSTTLLNRNRKRSYMEALSLTPADCRPFLQGRIGELQSGTPMGAVAEWGRQIRQVTARVDLEIHQTHRDVNNMTDLGVSGIACVMANPHPSPADYTAVSRNITVWARDLKRQNLKLRLDNLEDPRLLGQALDVQADACTSFRLWPAVTEPEGMKPYSREQFLKSLPATAAERRLTA
jgi:hypothetical protein